MRRTGICQSIVRATEGFCLYKSHLIARHSNLVTIPRLQASLILVLD